MKPYDMAFWMAWSCASSEKPYRASFSCIFAVESSLMLKSCTAFSKACFSCSSSGREAVSSALFLLYATLLRAIQMSLAPAQMLQ